MKPTKLYWFKVSSKKPTIVLVHNTWANHKVFKRHIEFLNALGYSCVSFDLKKAQIADKKNLTGWILSKTPIYEIWRDHVAEVYNLVEGEKISYGLSCPAMATLLASDNRDDIRASICDGGPFDDMWICTYRLFEQHQAIPTFALRATATTLGVWRYGLSAHKDLYKVLEHWPKNRPILSIRGGKDSLVYPENIEKVFAPHKKLPITRHLIKEGQHLDGLKNFPEEYKKVVSDFLKSIN